MPDVASPGTRSTPKESGLRCGAHHWHLQIWPGASRAASTHSLVGWLHLVARRAASAKCVDNGKWNQSMARRNETCRGIFGSALFQRRASRLCFDRRQIGGESCARGHEQARRFRAALAFGMVHGRVGVQRPVALGRAQKSVDRQSSPGQSSRLSRSADR